MGLFTIFNFVPHREILRGMFAITLDKSSKNDFEPDIQMRLYHVPAKIFVQWFILT